MIVAQARGVDFEQYSDGALFIVPSIDTAEEASKALDDVAKWLGYVFDCKGVEEIDSGQYLKDLEKLESKIFERATY